MKVVCINNSDGWHYLTKGKIYDIIKEDNYNYNIINNKGYNSWYPKSCFKLLSEIRNEKINKLLAE